MYGQKVEHVKRKEVEKASKSTTKSLFLFMKGKGKMEAMAATGVSRTGETMMRTSGSME